MRRIAAAAMLLLAALIQVTWAPRLQIAGAFPNLVLLAVMGITWQRGVRTGLAAACAGGVLLDLSSAGPVGPHVIALLAGVYVTGFWIRNVESGRAVHASASTAMATILYALVLLLSGMELRDSSVALTVAAQLTVASTIYNALLAPFAVALVRSLDAVRRAPQAT